MRSHHVGYAHLLPIARFVLSSAMTFGFLLQNSHQTFTEYAWRTHRTFTLTCDPFWPSKRERATTPTKRPERFRFPFGTGSCTVESPCISPYLALIPAISPVLTAVGNRRCAGSRPRRCLQRSIREGNRAGEVIAHVPSRKAFCRFTTTESRWCGAVA